jgi:hypothetical protein
MELKPGTRLESTTCDTQVVVVKAPAGDVDLRCGGAPMVELGQAGERTEPAAAQAEGTLMGKRYAVEELGMELLCSKAGAGSLSVGEERIGLKDAKPLPASD